MTAPRYQDVKAGDVPRVVDDDGADVRVVCGSYRGTKGTVDDLAAKPVYLDVAVPAGKRKVLPVETTRNAFVCVFAGGGKSHADNRAFVLFDRGDEVEEGTFLRADARR